MANEKKKFKKGDCVFYIQPITPNGFKYKDWNVFKGFVVYTAKNDDGDEILGVDENLNANPWVDKVLSIYAEYAFETEEEAQKAANEINEKINK